MMFIKPFCVRFNVLLDIMVVASSSYTGLDHVRGKSSNIRQTRHSSTLPSPQMTIVRPCITVSLKGFKHVTCLAFKHRGMCRSV